MGLSFAAPLAGRDDWEQPESTNPYKFQSTRPLRGATYCRPCLGDTSGHFNPRAPCGVRRETLWLDDRAVAISIHAPLAGCDTACCTICTPSRIFQSTHPLRGATIIGKRGPKHGSISIHAPLAGCDLSRPFPPPPSRHFNPRTPCGVRPVLPLCASTAGEFQSTHPLRGATAKAHKKMRHFCAKGINTSSLCAKNAHPAT